MSRKPLKHSEVGRSGKSTAARMKSGWGTSRPAPTIKIRPERHLIVSEGSKTEPYYFREMRDRINAGYHGEYISVEVMGLGMSTVSLFNRAAGFADLADYAHVWVVYDKDSFPSADFNRVEELCAGRSTEVTRYHAIWTNEAFELWYILHFEYLQTPLPRTDYEAKLSGYLEGMNQGPYRKNRVDMFNVLERRLADAIRNAERLELVNQGKTPTDSAPGTKVHLLVRELLPYIGSNPKNG